MIDYKNSDNKDEPIKIIDIFGAAGLALVIVCLMYFETIFDVFKHLIRSFI